MLELIFVIFFLILSFYFVFLPHDIQCNIIKIVFPNCFPNWLHIGAGLVCFGIAVLIYHNDYLLKLRIHE